MEVALTRAVEFVDAVVVVTLAIVSTRSFPFFSRNPDFDLEAAGWAVSPPFFGRPRPLEDGALLRGIREWEKGLVREPQ